jgi:hypothetical protein
MVEIRYEPRDNYQESEIAHLEHDMVEYCPQ